MIPGNCTKGSLLDDTRVEQILLILCSKSNGKGFNNLQVGPGMKMVLLKLGKECNKKKWASFLCMKNVGEEILIKGTLISCQLSFFMDKIL